MKVLQIFYLTIASVAMTTVTVIMVQYVYEEAKLDWTSYNTNGY